MKPEPSIEPDAPGEPSAARKRELAIKLTVLARQLWLTFDQSADKVGMTRAKWSVVAAVSHTPGATQRNIAGRLQVTDVTAGRLIDRLCAEGYLERHEDPDDRRAYRVYPTAPAKPLLDQLSLLADAHARQAFAGFDEKDLATLEGLLDAVSRNVTSGREKG